MGKQYRASRTLGVYTLNAGQPLTIELPRQYDLESLRFRLDAVVQVTAAATSVKTFAPFQLLPRLELIADGKNTVFSGSAIMCRIASDRGLSSGTQITPPSGTAVASYTVSGVFAIDLQAFDCVRPKDTNFRTSGLNLWQLRLTAGQAGDMFNGGTVNLTSATITVSVDECIELPDQTGAYSKPAFMKRVSTQTAAFAGAQSNFDFRLPAGNTIKQVAVFATDSTGLAVNTVSNFKLAAGLDVRVNESGQALSDKLYTNYGTKPAGLFLHDFVNVGSVFGPQGQLSNLWDVSQSVEPKLTVDVSAACTLEVRTTELIRLN